MAEENNSMGNPIRHTASTDSVRPEHGALARREYGLLAPTETAVDTVDVGNQGIGDGHEATRGTADQARRETEEGDETRKNTLPVRGM